MENKTLKFISLIRSDRIKGSLFAPNYIHKIVLIAGASSNSGPVGYIHFHTNAYREDRNRRFSQLPNYGLNSSVDSAL